MSLFPRPLIVIDTETTGLLDDRDAMPWEIGAVLLDVEGREVAHFDESGRSRVFEQRHRDVVSTISGFDPDLVAAFPRDIHTVSNRFVDWLDSHFPSRCGVDFVAFNNDFDRVMLRRVGVHLWQWAPCLMERAKAAMGPSLGEPGSRLDRAAKFYGVEREGHAHRALSDARLAGRIAVEMAIRSTTLPSGSRTERDSEEV